MHRCERAIEILAAILATASAIADSPTRGSAWSRTVPNTELTIASSERGKPNGESAELSLRRGTNVLWSVRRPFVSEEEVLVAPDASAVALFASPGFILLGPDGHERGHFDLNLYLTAEEQEHLSFRTNGAELDVSTRTLVFTATAAASAPPRYQRPNAPLKLTFHLDSLTFARPSPVAIVRGRSCWSRGSMSMKASSSAQGAGSAQRTNT